MEKTTATVFGKAVNTIMNFEKTPKQHTSPKRYLKEGTFVIFAFCCGRAFLFQMLNPLCFAFLSARFLEGNVFYILLLTAGFGIWSAGISDGILKYGMGLLFYGVFHFILGKKMKSLTAMQKSILGGSLTVLVGIFYAIICDLSQYLTFLAMVEGIMVFTLTFVFEKGLSVLKGSMKRRILTSEEMISLSVVLGSVLAGISGVLILGIPVEMVFSVLFILIAGYRGGAGIGAAAGVLFGFFLMTAGGVPASIFCILSVSGLVCGSLGSMGKLISCISFLLCGMILSFYMDSGFLTRETAIAAFTGSILFFLLPRRSFSFLNTYACYEKEFDEDIYFIRTKEMVQERLSNFAKGFSALAKTFHGISREKKSLDQRDVSCLIDDVAARVCQNCGLKTYCWEKDFYHTYQTIFSVLSACERKGQIEKKDIPDKFRGNCLHLDYFLEMMNRTFDRYQNNLIWENRLRESRELVSHQLGAVAEIIGGISKEIDFQPVFQESLEKELRAKLDQAKWNVRKVSIMENQNGSCEVTMELPYGNGKNWNSITQITKEVLGKRMKRVSVSNKEDRCILKLEEESRLQVSTGVALAVKDKSEVSGDSYSFLELKDGQYMLALSDGMGSGKKANQESVTTIELLEQFIECGFDKELALKMINSVLILKSGEEIFSTLDICSINRYTGQAEFIKVGAAPAYLLRGEEVRAIRSCSLPVGMLKELDIERIDLMLKPNDILIMMTDGIGDMIEKEKKGEYWIQELFQNFRSYNPQDIAEYILIQVKKKYPDEIRDDMTVMAARIWEK